MAAACSCANGSLAPQSLNDRRPECSQHTIKGHEAFSHHIRICLRSTSGSPEQWWIVSVMSCICLMTDSWHSRTAFASSLYSANQRSPNKMTPRPKMDTDAPVATSPLLCHSIRECCGDEQPSQVARHQCILSTVEVRLYRVHVWAHGVALHVTALIFKVL